MADKILVVEDELVLRETLTYNLTRQGYEVLTAADGHRAVELARDRAPDLILLDLMLPGLDGFEVCRIVREESNAPIIMLTARDDEVDTIVGLEVGADDYLTKPFSMRELLARVKAQLRRVRALREQFAEDASAIALDANSPPPTGEGPGERGGSALLRLDNLSLDPDRREVRLNDEVLPLKPKEYELLAYFARKRGRVLTRDQILEDVWGWDFTGGSRTVDVHVRWLREKIEDDPASPSRIITVRGAGYRFDG
jgi:DNA-binding response OmpR family regulator